MPSVRVRENEPFEVALRRFKRTIEKTGLLTELRAQEATRLSTIRMLLAAMKQREVDERIELADADVVAIIDKMIKQRRESIVQFDAGNRPDLAAAERAEIALLQAYMPQPLSET